jgi:CDP-diacylglycerol--glycerol-3-phosphate 3-phosphatidyltransferase
MNLPNKLTFSRIFLIPVLMVFYLLETMPYGKIIAGVIFVIAIFTDFLDGYIARKHNLVTDLGKFLDPIADKMLVTAGLLLVVADGTVPAPFGVVAIFIILSRDFIVGVLRQMAAAKGTVIAADKLGKFKTVMQDFALIFLFVLSYFNVGGIMDSYTYDIYSVASYTLLAIAILLTIISGFNYIIKNRKLFK